MTKKHFKAIAEIIKWEIGSSKHKDNPESRWDSIKAIAVDLSRSFAGFNERFDKGLFLNACGMDAQTILEG